MLREIINFTKSISQESYNFRLVPVEGIHFQIKLDNTGQLIDHQYAFYKKGFEISKFLKDCLVKQNNTKYISMNKAFDSKKKIHSCSPFCIAFKIQSISDVQNRFDDYFKIAEKYCEKEEHIKLMNLFHQFIKVELVKLVQEDIEKVVKEQTEKDKRFKLFDKYYVYVYLTNVTNGDYENAHHKYLTEGVFNKEEYNRPIDDEIFGVSDYLSGYNVKKPFLHHQTATFNLNYRFSSSDALTLFKFSQLQ